MLTGLVARAPSAARRSIGVISIELYTEHAPKTCKNFLELSKRGYYSGAQAYAKMWLSELGDGG